MQLSVLNICRPQACNVRLVIPEIDIWRAATLMLKRYGDKALEQSRTRIDELAADGDHDGAPFAKVERHLRASSKFRGVLNHVAHSAPYSLRAAGECVAGRAAIGDIEADVDIIAYLLSIPRMAEDVFGALAPQRRKERIFAAILRWLECEARKTPLLLKLEDIHWADPTTTELLSLLIEWVERLPIMFVATRRPNVQPSWTARPIASGRSF